jgi:hypothetical protein
MIVYTTPRKETTVPHTTNQLFFEIIRAAHDPVQSTRYRPYLYSAAPRWPNGAPRTPEVTFNVTRVVSRVRGLIVGFLDRRPIQRTAPVPCC